MALSCKPMKRVRPIGWLRASIRKRSFSTSTPFMVSRSINLSLNANNKPEGHQGGASSPLWSQAHLVAIDYKTGQIRWTRNEGEGEGHPGIPDDSRTPALHW